LPSLTNLLRKGNGHGKKRTINSSLLEEEVWSLLQFPETPTGEKHLQLWPIIFTKCGGSLRYLSLLNGELQGTHITLPTGTEQTNDSLRASFWGQMQLDMEKNIGAGSRSIANRQWDTVE